MAKKAEITVTPSWGNVFADLGFAEPEEKLAKAQIASRIQDIFKERCLTQTAAGSLMGLDQPMVSALLNGRLSNCSDAAPHSSWTRRRNRHEVPISKTSLRPYPGRRSTNLTLITRPDA